MAQKKDLKYFLKQYIYKIKENIRLDTIILYGSCAKGKQNENSDIDIAIISDKFGKNPLSEIAFLCKLRRDINVNIEPLAFSVKEYKKHSPVDFIQEIINTGKIIYHDGRIYL